MTTQNTTVNLWHGTYTSALGSIRATGLVPGCHGGADDAREGSTDRYKRCCCVYVTDSLATAQDIALWASEYHGSSEGVVLELRIPADVFARMIEDPGVDQSWAGAWMSFETLLPEWIIDVQPVKVEDVY